MRSRPLSSHSFVCSHTFLEFDYKLNDISASNTEKLSIEFYMDSTWTVLDSMKNQGSTDWIHTKLELPSANVGDFFKVGFSASGSLSSNITGWLIDNIKVSGFCNDPVNVMLTTTGNVVGLSWQPPCGSDSTIPGYNVYRSDISGNPPFILLNNLPVSGHSYLDTIPAGISSGVYRYRVSALYIDSNNPGPIVCESAGEDTLSVSIPLGISQISPAGVSVSPNPASDFVIVNSKSPVELCRIYNLIGEMVFSFDPGEKTIFKLSVSGIPSGIYFLKIFSANRLVRTVKLVVK